MMVSKVAVVALVAIVACPILLGYGMNLEQNTYTEYGVSKDPLDVTPLLKNGDKYSTAHADFYKLNTKFETAYGNYDVMPLYQGTMTSSGSYPYGLGQMDWVGGGWGLSNSESTFMYFDYDINDGNYVVLTIYGGGGVVVGTIYAATYFYYDRATDTIVYAFNNIGYQVIEDGQISGVGLSGLNVTLVNMATVHVYYGVKDSNTATYVDFSKGFRLGNDQTYPLIILPDYTKSYLMTINLNSVTEANFDMMIDDGYALNYLTKRTINGVVNWYFRANGGDTLIYYDSSRSDNTYQFYITQTGEYQSGGRIYYTTHAELRYIGGWPTLVGEARSYLTYERDADRSAMPYDPVYGFNHIRVYTTDLYGFNQLSPIIRMDDATFSAFQYSVIQDKVYDPAGFRSNPATTITDIAKYGTYLTFGGVQFDVTDGNITLGTHEVSIKNLVFKSVPVAGGFENRIGDTVISTSVTPSTITFGGEWGAKVTTDSMAQITYTHTDWTPGEFAWDGIDQNFLMIGLLTALGVFIALGIAYRKAKSALWALLVVCGGAAVLFFTML